MKATHLKIARVAWKVTTPTNSGQLGGEPHLPSCHP